MDNVDYLYNCIRPLHEIEDGDARSQQLSDRLYEAFEQSRHHPQLLVQLYRRGYLKSSDTLLLLKEAIKSGYAAVITTLLVNEISSVPLVHPCS